jgi:hypothetical protein
MNIARKNRKIILLVYNYAFIPALIKVPYPIVLPIVITGISDVELSHKFSEIAQWGLNKQVKMVSHEDVTE